MRHHPSARTTWRLFKLIRPPSWLCPGQGNLPVEKKTKVWQGSIDGTNFDNRALLLQAQSKSRFFQLKAKAVKKFASDSKMLTLTYQVAVDLCKWSSVQCTHNVKLAKTNSNDLTQTKVTAKKNAAIKGIKYDYIKNLNTDQSQAWYTDTIGSIINQNGADVNGVVDSFVIEVTFSNKMPLIQSTIKWSDGLLQEEPLGCAVFKMEGKHYTRTDKSKVGKMDDKYKTLKISGGSVQTCDMGDAEADKGYKACVSDDKIGTLWSPGSCEKDGCPLEAKATNKVNPYRATQDMYQFYKAPVVNSLQYTCQKTAGINSDGGSYQAKDQKISMGNWIIYGLKMDPAGTDNGCNNDEVKGCDNKCYNNIVLGDGVCDESFNCKAKMYDEMDCLAQCEETPDSQGNTCAKLYAKGVTCNQALASGYDCSCTC